MLYSTGNNENVGSVDQGTEAAPPFVTVAVFIATASEHVLVEHGSCKYQSRDMLGMMALGARPEAAGARPLHALPVETTVGEDV